MITSHLTDAEIQQHLDGLMTESDEKARHLATCAHCQLQLSVFRTIYQVSSEMPVVIDPMLADSVMGEIIVPINKNVYPRTESLVFAGMISCFVVIVFLFRFSDVIITKDFWSLFTLRYNGELFALVAFAGVLLVGFQWLDGKMLKKIYTRKNLI
jgi:hypothetical protein